MTNPSHAQSCISCSIFRKEIEALQAAGKLNLPVSYLNSMLHLVPDRLEDQLQQTLAEARAAGQEVVLAYGDCCGHMEEFGTQPGVHRTEGINCCEIVLGHETYRKLRREGAFFLMPEWALSWKKIFISQLGLMGPCAKAFMQEMHTKLIYLDTGVLPVPHTELVEASEFLGLPVEILPVTLEPLLVNLQQSLKP